MAVIALQRSVGRLLCGSQLSDAVRQGRRQESISNNAAQLANFVRCSGSVLAENDFVPLQFIVAGSPDSAGGRVTGGPDGEPKQVSNQVQPGPVQSDWIADDSPADHP